MLRSVISLAFNGAQVLNALVANNLGTKLYRIDTSSCQSGGCASTCLIEYFLADQSQAGGAVVAQHENYGYGDRQNPYTLSDSMKETLIQLVRYELTLQYVAKLNLRVNVLEGTTLVLNTLQNNLLTGALQLAVSVGSYSLNSTAVPGAAFLQSDQRLLIQNFESVEFRNIEFLFRQELQCGLSFVSVQNVSLLGCAFAQDECLNLIAQSSNLYVDRLAIS